MGSNHDTQAAGTQEELFAMAPPRPAEVARVRYAETVEIRERKSEPDGTPVFFVCWQTPKRFQSIQRPTREGAEYFAQVKRTTLARAYDK